MTTTRIHIAAGALLLSFLVAPSGAVAQTCPTSGGTLTIGSLSSPRQLDPHKVASADDYVHSFWMYNALTRITPDLSVKPDLAESWEPSEDLTKWRFNLRRGVRFHDGREMTADDVVASIRRVQDPATGSIGRGLIAMIEEVTALDPHTVAFSLSLPYADLPNALGSIQVKIAPHDMLETLAERPVGTGPFRFAELVPGSQIRLVRNDDYFMPDQPCLDEVVYRVLPEALVAGTALRRGEIDIWYRIPADQITSLQRAGNDIVVEGAPTASFDALIVHNQREPFSDRRFRLALNYATDKQQVVDAVLFGFGTPVETPISPASPMFNKDLPRREQDIERAKALLAEVGYPDGIDLTVVAPAGRVNRERLALVLQEMWRPAGIRLRVERVPWDKFVADVELKADMYVSGWAGRATVDQMLQVAIHSTATYNLWHYQNPEVDRLIDEGRRATTPQEQARIYARMQQLLFDDPPGVVAYVLNDYTAYRRSVHNYRIHPLFGVMYLDDVWIQP